MQELSFNSYCPFLDTDIHMGLCVEILAELDDLKKDEFIGKYIKEKEKEGISITREKILAICERCHNWPG